MLYQPVGELRHESTSLAMSRFRLAVARVLRTCQITALLGTAAIPQPGAAQLVRGVVRSTSGVPLARAELLVLPESLSVYTTDSGHFVLGPLRSGRHDLHIRRLGFAPVALSFEVSLTDTVITVQLNSLAQLLDTVRAAALAQRLPRVFARQRAHLGAVVYGSSLETLLNREPGMPLEDLMRMAPAFALKLMHRPGCSQRTYVDGVRTRAPLRFYISESEIGAIEVFDSPDFVHEPFLDGEGFGAGSCMILTLIWSKQYQQPPWAGR